MELCKELSPFIGISVTKIYECAYLQYRNMTWIVTILCISFLDISLLKLDRNIIFCAVIVGTTGLYPKFKNKINFMIITDTFCVI